MGLTRARRGENPLRWIMLAGACSVTFLIFLASQLLHSRFQAESGAAHHTRSFVAAVIFNRVFAEDKFNITGRECRQWIEYMLYAGVDHIYWYDTAHSDDESQRATLAPYADAGLLTYHRFYHIFPVVPGSDFHYEQDTSYRHFIATYNASVEWAVEMDVDEYPYSESDGEDGFVARYLARLESSISQVLLECMIFAGNPQGEGFVIERYLRRNPRSEGRTPMGFGSRHKPIFKPAMSSGVTNYDPHCFKMRRGTTVVAEAQHLRMNHYWGPRETDFGPDTPQVNARLVRDEGMLQLAARLRRKWRLPYLGFR